MRLSKCLFLLLALPALACGGPADDGGGEGRTVPPTADEIAAAYDRGLDYLKTAAEEAPEFGDPGFQGLVVTAFLRRPGGIREEDEEFVETCLDSLVAMQKENGGIYARGVANYATCASIMALAEAEQEKYAGAIEKAAAFVKTLQAASGGIGYSDKTTPDDPDLSNTQFAAEALRAAGVPQEDRVYSHMLKFLQTVQNRTESNPGGYEVKDGTILAPGDDGGAYYKPTESKAGYEENEDGTVTARSYGSTTYALLKCYLLAGLDADDPRVKAAVDWIRNHWTLEENPGFDTAEDPDAGFQGYFYYLMTMAKALTLLDVEKVEDSDGLEHDWRAELSMKLLDLQRNDGSWKNERNDRWFEDKPLLAGAYALTALSYCSQ